ncbi:hypothetical protein [Yoonia sp. SDW83-1]|uniref:hypothetical protein n=1 Tax=Yoonia sp. SDW83-1 TaxID=3366945 RepID=UPI00398C2EA2
MAWTAARQNLRQCHPDPVNPTRPQAFQTNKAAIMCGRFEVFKRFDLQFFMDEMRQIWANHRDKLKESFGVNRAAQPVDHRQ